MKNGFKILIILTVFIYNSNQELAKCDPNECGDKGVNQK